MEITYLFGAGASAGCLPVVKDIPKRLRIFKTFVRDNAKDLPDPTKSGITPSELFNLFLNECEDLADKAEAHASIDTYAKKLRLNIPITGGIVKKKYYYLKVILSAFFMYEQLKSKPDSRYDSFFASILDDSVYTFPKNVKILSWNYDFQFEKSFSEYNLEKKLPDLQKNLRVFDASVNPNYEGDFGIFKLNGTTSFTKKGTRDTHWNLNDTVDSFEPSKLIMEFLNAFDAVNAAHKTNLSNLTFAWERTWTEEIRNFLDLVEAAVAETEVLVVIGYSFPFFNRPVDKRMLKSESLSKVYIQDLYPETIKSSLRSVLPENSKAAIELLTVSSDPKTRPQFFLPPEL